MSEPLSEEEDAFGRLLLDHLAGDVGPLILELDDGRPGPALPAEVFFAEHREWPTEKQQVFELVRGRVCSTWAAEPGGTAWRRSAAGSTS